MGNRSDSMDMRDRILAATRRCLIQYGAPKTGISDVAAEAGVSRQSIYTHVGDRSCLIRAALLAEGEEFSDRIAAHLADLPGGPRELVSEAILFVLRELPQDPLLRVFASLERERARDEIVLDFSSAMSHEFARQALGPVQDRCRHASDADIELLADLMLRLTMTLFLVPLPGGHAEDHVRRTLKRWFTTFEWLE